MDSERVPPLPQSEITSPVHAFTSGTIQPFNPSHSNVPRKSARTDSSNSNPYSDNELKESPSSEKLEPIPRLPEPISGKRGTGINNRQLHSGIDWIVPIEERDVGKRTVADRLDPTIDLAVIEKDKYSAKAKWTGYALNAAIGMQVLLGALTTGLSALAVSGGKSTAAATTALGALATLVASYLAQMRGSNELDLSITRAKNLEQFIRECQSFTKDHGHLSSPEFDPEIVRLRHRFEEILGNTNRERKVNNANGEQKVDNANGELAHLT